jgi:hypothetical protein
LPSSSAQSVGWAKARDGRFNVQHDVARPCPPGQMLQAPNFITLFR